MISDTFWVITVSALPPLGLLMHRPVRSLLAAVATIPLLLSAAPAQATTAAWVASGPNRFLKIATFVPGALAGQPGNWHGISIDVDQDDDGITGGVTNWQCAGSASPLSELAACERLSGWSFYGDESLASTFSPRLAFGRIVGSVLLENDETQEVVTAKLDLRLRADGDYTREVDVDLGAGTDVGYDDWKVITKTREGVTVTGRLGAFRANGPGVVTDISALTEVEFFVREPAAGS